jgi:hypothetical protein
MKKQNHELSFEFIAYLDILRIDNGLYSSPRERKTCEADENRVKTTISFFLSTSRVLRSLFYQEHDPWVLSGKILVTA